MKRNHSWPDFYNNRWVHICRLLLVMSQPITVWGKQWFSDLKKGWTSLHALHATSKPIYQFQFSFPSCSRLASELIFCALITTCVPGGMGGGPGVDEGGEKHLGPSYLAGRAKNKCNYDVTSAVKPSSFRYPFLACHVRILSLMYFVIVYCLLVASISGVFSIYLFYLFWSKGNLASFRTSTELINFSPTRNAYSYPLRQVPLIQPDQK